MFTRVILLREKLNVDKVINNLHLSQNAQPSDNMFETFTATPMVLNRIVKNYQDKLRLCGIIVNLSKAPSSLDFTMSSNANFSATKLSQRIDTFFEKLRSIKLGRGEYHIFLNHL